MFEYLVHPAAEKELIRFPLEVQKHITEEIKEICKLSHPMHSRNVKKLKGYREPTFRLRVGDYRAKFVIRKPSLLYIIDIDNRQAGY